MERIGRLEAQHHGSGIVVTMQPFEHGAHCRCFHEGHIAIKDEHIAREIRQRAFGLLNRMGGAELRFLQTGRCALAHVLLDLVTPRAHHDRGPLWSEFRHTCHEVFKHGAARDGVQHLMRIAFHAGALARGKDDGGERMCRGRHGACL